MEIWKGYKTPFTDPVTYKKICLFHKTEDKLGKCLFDNVDKIIDRKLMQHKLT